MGTRGEVLSGFLIGTLFLGLVGCGGGGERLLAPPILQSIEVTPTNPVIALDTSQQLTATGIYSDGSKNDLTATVTWSSATASVATVSNTAGSNGVATAVAAGSTVITASTESIFGTTTLTVTPVTLVSIQLSPASATIARGTNQQFIAVGIFNDNSKQDITFDVTWASSNPAVATIGNILAAKGLATAVGAGTTIISATLDAVSVSASATLNVTTVPLVAIEVTPTAASTPKGTTVQFIATGIYSDNSTQDLTRTVTWSSLNPGAATVSNAPGVNGLVTAVAAGSVPITATSGSISGSTALNVTAATLTSIEVSPTNPKLPTKATLQLTAMGTYSDHSTVDLTSQVIWNSSTVATAIVNNTAGTNGLATASAVGTTTVTATMGGVSGATLITVTPAVLVAIDLTPTQPTMAQGTWQQFAATGTYSDNTTQDLTTAVTWTSSDETIATISNASSVQGLVTALIPGTVTITAVQGSVTMSTTITVTSATLVSVEVTPTTPDIPKGTTQQFAATGIYSDNTTQDLTAQATWSSSSKTVAAISNAAGSKGLATALAPVTTTITATMAGMTGSTTPTVTSTTLQSITVTPDSLTTLPLGITRQYRATGTYTDASKRDITEFVTWASSIRSVATLSNAGGTKGVATPVAAGSTTFAATSGGIVSTDATLTVNAATLSSLSILPLTPQIAVGTTQIFTARGNFLDGSVQDLTTQVAWNSSALTVATISNQASTKGVATAVTSGPTTIRAAFGNVTTSTPLTVTPATLSFITIIPPNKSIIRTATQKFTAIGRYTDDSTQDLTQSVTWSSSSNSVATISNAQGTQGLAKGLGTGTTTIRAVKSNSAVAAGAILVVQ